MSLSWAQPSSFGRTSQVNDDVVLKTRSEGQLQIRAIENIQEQNSVGVATLELNLKYRIVISNKVVSATSKKAVMRSMWMASKTNSFC